MRTTAREVVSTLRSAAWPIALTHRLPEARPGVARPALLVHGFMGHREMLRPLARRLLLAGWGPIARVGYPSTQVSLQDIADRIDAAARPLSAHGRIDLVGHSLGAVACRAWLKLRGGDRYVRHFVSLGGPHAGTSLYRMVPAPLREVLDPRGRWVHDLAEGPEPVPTTVIRARYDHQVFPPERAAIPDAEDVILSGLGHNGLLWSAEAHAAVIAALARGPRADYTPAR